MVLALTFTVAGVVVLIGVVVAWVEIRDPTTDTSTATSSLINIITGMMGALLGLLAGKSSTVNSIERVPKPEDDEE